MSQVSIKISTGMMNMIAEQQTSSSNVNVRKGMPVIPGTAQNQAKPIPTGTSGILRTISGIAQNDANAGDSFRMAIVGQVCIARVNSAVSKDDYLTVKTGSTTDAENGSLETQSTIANNDLLVARALEDGTDKSYIKVVVVMQRLPAS